MSIELIVRIIFFFIFGIIGVFISDSLGELFQQTLLLQPNLFIIYRILTPLITGAIGFVIAPWISIKPLHALRKHLSKVSAQTLVYGLIGLLVGLLLSALLAYPHLLASWTAGQHSSLCVCASVGLSWYHHLCQPTKRIGDFFQILLKSRWFLK